VTGAGLPGLVVTTGGATSVVTDDLVRLAAGLDDAGARLDDHARALALPPLVSRVTGEHDAGLDVPRGLLASAAHDARTLAVDLRRAAAEYADGERDVDRCVRSASGDGGAGPGGLLDDVVRLPADALRFLGLAGTIALRPDGPGRLVLPAAVGDAVSDIAAAATGSAPDAGAREDAVRTTTAGLLALVGSVGLLRDASASVHVHPDALRPAPSSLADLAARIPDPDPGAPQMRVEEYRAPDGRRRFVAYLGGMLTLDPRTGREDFGPASAAAALATEGGSAVQAAETALRDAGATADDEVYVVGYSMAVSSPARRATTRPSTSPTSSRSARPSASCPCGGGSTAWRWSTRTTPSPPSGARARRPATRATTSWCAPRRSAPRHRPARSTHTNSARTGRRQPRWTPHAPRSWSGHATSSTASSTARRRSPPTSTGRSEHLTTRPARGGAGCDPRFRPGRSPGAAPAPPAS
jgi:hypothetical protein